MMLNPEEVNHEAFAELSGQEASREFKSALVTSAVFGAAAFLAHEALEQALPSGAFREAAANTVLTLGGIAAGVTAAAGTLTAARLRADEIKHLRMARQAAINK